jgi:hypothetical protein
MMTVGETAFCLAVVVVVVLLFIFGPGFFRHKHKRKEHDDSDSESDDEDHVARDMQRRSDTGTGVLNARAAARYQKASSSLAGYSDFGTFAQFIALEPEVFESHANYTTDMNRMSLGPSTLSERSDPNDLHKWTVRPPDYSAVYADENARTEHSEIPDQMRSRGRNYYY